MRRDARMWARYDRGPGERSCHRARRAAAAACPSFDVDRNRSVAVSE
jgi:hypothetical protein